MVVDESLDPPHAETPRMSAAAAKAATASFRWLDKNVLWRMDSLAATSAVGSLPTRWLRYWIATGTRRDMFTDAMQAHVNKRRLDTWLVLPGVPNPGVLA